MSALLEITVENLMALDQALFRLINSDWTLAPLDLLMPFVTDLHRNWIAVGLVLPATLALWLWRTRGQAIKTIVALLLAVSASDLISYRVIKPLVERPRPEAAGMSPRLIVPSQGGPSFPSNHAANTFAEATILWLVFRRRAWIAFVYAAVVAYSRVYVGVHFPLDVLGGAAVGGLCGWLSWRTLRAWITSPLWRPAGSTPVQK